MINTFKGLSQVQEPSHNKLTCINTFTPGLNNIATIPHVEWNDLTESQTDMVKIDRILKV